MISDKEYTFDVKLFTEVHVRARSEKDARELLERVIDDLYIQVNTTKGEVRFTGVYADGDRVLTEIDGEDPKDVSDV